LYGVGEYQVRTATDALVGYAVEFLNFYRDAVVLLVRPDGMWEH